MTVVISDTGPLNYLVLIEQISVLPRLFDGVVVPTGVVEELGHENTPEPVKAWVRNLPSWVTIESAEKEMEGLAELNARVDHGEICAMAVAIRLNHPILMDDRRAREAASELGLTTIGTLAVLEAAATRGWLEFREAAEQLRIHGFYLSDALIEEIAGRIEDEQVSE